MNGKDEITAECLEPTRRSSAKIYSDRVRLFFQGSLNSEYKPSPFLLHWAFHAFQYYHTIYRREGHSETLQVLKDIEKSFEILDTRWKLAG